MKVRLGATVEEIPRIRVAVPIELVYIAVKFVGAGFRNDIDHIAATETILSGKGVRLNLKLLDVVDGRNINHPAPIQARIPGSIEQVLRRVEESTAEIQERNILVRAPGNSGRTYDLLFRRVADRRISLRQADNVAKVQGKIGHLLRAD